jgi:hypothetical protein
MVQLPINIGGKVVINTGEELTLLLWSVWTTLYGSDYVSGTRLHDIVVFIAMLWQFNEGAAKKFAELAINKDPRIMERDGF